MRDDEMILRCVLKPVSNDIFRGGGWWFQTVSITLFESPPPFIHKLLEGGGKVDVVE
jgi:hypothetical protein